MHSPNTSSTHTSSKPYSPITFSLRRKWHTQSTFTHALSHPLLSPPHPTPSCIHPPTAYILHTPQRRLRSPRRREGCTAILRQACCTVLYYTVLYHTVLYCTILLDSTAYYSPPHPAGLFCCGRCVWGDVLLVGDGKKEGKKRRKGRKKREAWEGYTSISVNASESSLHIARSASHCNKDRHIHELNRARRQHGE